MSETKPLSRVKRLAPGFYENAEGLMIARIEGSRFYGGTTWMVTPPGERYPADAFDTLRDARRAYNV